MPQDISMRQGPESITVWPNLTVRRPMFVGGGVSSDTEGRRQNYFQLETCSQGLIKSLKKCRAVQAENRTYWKISICVHVGELSQFSQTWNTIPNFLCTKLMTQQPFCRLYLSPLLSPAGWSWQRQQLSQHCCKQGVRMNGYQDVSRICCIWGLQ